MTSAYLCLILVFAIAGFSSAAVIHFPGEQATIQKGIDAAQHGDTVLVANGNYQGVGKRGLRFRSKIIEVRSENGPEYTIIDAENKTYVFSFEGGEGRLSVVDGFTITGGDVDAIYCYDNASPTIINNIIIGNPGIGIHCQGGSSLIKNNIITQNDGGGIKCQRASEMEIDGNIIMNNTALNGAGIYCVQGNELGKTQTISNNTIIWNSATVWGGGGIYCHTSSPKIINNTICFNTTTGSGGGIYSGFSSTPTVLNTILWGNTSPEIELDRGTIYVTYSDVKGGWPGEGNIAADPLFVDPDNGDYHLQAGSPCIDAGDPDSPNDPDGTRADIGAFYYDQKIPTVLEIVSGDNQSGVIGTNLPGPLVVLLKDQNSNPMSDVQVDFAVTQGDGNVNPTQAITDSEGKASTELTLGQTAGLNQVTATVNELSVIFNATGIEPPVATTLEKVSGDNQIRTIDQLRSTNSRYNARRNNWTQSCRGNESYW